jgi:hypothetical protein
MSTRASGDGGACCVRAPCAGGGNGAHQQGMHINVAANTTIVASLCTALLCL